MDAEDLLGVFGLDVLTDPNASGEAKAAAVLGGEAGARRRAELADQLDDSRTWVAPNGYRLSDRVWAAGRAERDGIDAVLRRGVAEAWGPAETARALRAYALDPAAGAGYAMRRLARTEITRAFGKGTLDAAAANPFVRGIRWRLPSNHRPDRDRGVCQRNATGGPAGDGVYPVGAVPAYPAHPMERCALLPVAEEDTDAVVAQLRRDYGLDGSDAPGAAGHQRRPIPTTAARVRPYFDALGVQVDEVGASPQAWRIVSESFARLADEGHALPKRISFVEWHGDDTVAFFDPRARQVGSGFASVSDPIVSFNTAHDYWRAAKREAKFAHKTGWWSMDDPHGVVYHEIGHALNYEALSTPDPTIPGASVLDVRLWDSKRINAMLPDADERVSRYAQETTSEFVAEVFAGRMTGRTYDDEVMRVYRELKGPE